jgi:hypothetical protein
MNDMSKTVDWKKWKNVNRLNFKNSKNFPGLVPKFMLIERNKKKTQKHNKKDILRWIRIGGKKGEKWNGMEADLLSMNYKSHDLKPNIKNEKNILMIHISLSEMKISVCWEITVDDHQLVLNDVKFDSQKSKFFYKILSFLLKEDFSKEPESDSCLKASIITEEEKKFLQTRSLYRWNRPFDCT